MEVAVVVLEGGTDRLVLVLVIVAELDLLLVQRETKEEEEDVVVVEAAQNQLVALLSCSYDRNNTNIINSSSCGSNRTRSRIRIPRSGRRRC